VFDELPSHPEQLIERQFAKQSPPTIKYLTCLEYQMLNIVFGELPFYQLFRV
jgi:hypothetical protein